jgi:hypothetical protein
MQSRTFWNDQKNIGIQKLGFESVRRGNSMNIYRGTPYRGITLSFCLLLLAGAQSKMVRAQMHSPPSPGNMTQPDSPLVSDSEMVNMKATDWRYHEKLQRRSRRFFIWGALFTAVGVPLTIRGYTYMLDRSAEEANEPKDDDDSGDIGLLLYAFPLCNGMVTLGGGITLLVFAIVNRHRYNRLVRSRFSWQFHISPQSRNTTFSSRSMGMHLRWTF